MTLNKQSSLIFFCQSDCILSLIFQDTSLFITAEKTESSMVWVIILLDCGVTDDPVLVSQDLMTMITENAYGKSIPKAFLV